MMARREIVSKRFLRRAKSREWLQTFLQLATTCKEVSSQLATGKPSWCRLSRDISQGKAASHVNGLYIGVSYTLVAVLG